MRLCKLILSQNYFQHLNSQYIQTNGLAVGAPTSSIFSETLLQYLESTTIFNICINHKILGYFRYVNDILTIYKENQTNIREVLDTFSGMSPTMKFTKLTFWIPPSKKLNKIYQLASTENQLPQT